MKIIQKVTRFSKLVYDPRIVNLGSGERSVNLMQ